MSQLAEIPSIYLNQLQLHGPTLPLSVDLQPNFCREAKGRNPVPTIRPLAVCQAFQEPDVKARFVGRIKAHENVDKIVSRAPIVKNFICMAPELKFLLGSKFQYSYFSTSHMVQ